MMMLLLLLALHLPLLWSKQHPVRLYRDRNLDRIETSVADINSLNNLSGNAFTNTTTVYIAVILTDPYTSSIMGRDFKNVPQGVNGSQIDNALKRISHARAMLQQLPFKNIEYWWSVFVQACPGRKTKGNDRGVSSAHQQIWLDWVYRGDNPIGTRSVSEVDALVVLEDDAVIVVNNVEKSLRYELARMDGTDLVFLGWCYGQRAMPMCTHAYALTRAGARKLLREWDTCSTQSIDGQWKQLAQSGKIAWRKVGLVLSRQHCSVHRRLAWDRPTDLLIKQTSTSSVVPPFLPNPTLSLGTQLVIRGHDSRLP